MTDFIPYGGEPQALRPGACAVIFDAVGRVLLGKRADNGHWALPGGGLDLGESLEACCVREVREETGLEVRVLRLVGVYSDPRFNVIRYPNGVANQSVSATFECQILGGSLRIDPETLEFGWFDPQALPEPFFPNHRPRLSDALERLAEAFFR